MNDFEFHYAELSVRFRWVACQLDSLGDCFHLPHLRQTLASLPKTLDDTYARILCNIDKRYNFYNRHILKILQWLAFSVRPLQLEELAEIFAIDVDETPRFDPQRRLFEPRDILTICSSLITLTNDLHMVSDEESDDEEEEESATGLSEESQDPDTQSLAGTSDSERSKTYVRLAHFSVKEYLVSVRIRHGAAPLYSIREIESHGVLAEDCIAYLLKFDEPGSLTPETLGLSPLAHYAAEHWVKHAKMAEKGPVRTTALLSMELLMADGEGFLNWIRIWDTDVSSDHMSGGLENLVSPLYYVSRAGLLESAKMLIEGSMDVNAPGGFYGNALQAASHSGYIDLVHLLLNNGADINAQGGYYGNALQAALFSGYIDLVRLLLHKGADINAQGGRHGNALQAASHLGRIDVVHLLLHKGADINAQGGYFGNALQVASVSGHIDLVHLLLNNGADINAQGGYYGNVLQAASFSGYIDLVHLLLDNGADINAQGGDYGNALQAASLSGYIDLVHLLLDNGADINAQGGYYGNALQAASNWGHIDVIHLLLNNEADINAQSGYYGNALQAASHSGYIDLVRLLLANGADINAQGGDYGNALQAASHLGYIDVVQVLVDKGADVNARGGRWGSALQAAYISSHENIVKMLKAKGAVWPENEISSDEQESDLPLDQVRAPTPTEAPPAHSDSSSAPE